MGIQVISRETSAPSSPAAGFSSLYPIGASDAATVYQFKLPAGTTLTMGTLESAQTWSGLQTFSAGITLSGTASNIATGSNFISNGGTDAGLSFDGSNNASFSAKLNVTTSVGINGDQTSTGIDTGSTKLYVAAPNSNFGAALTTRSDSLGRNFSFADQTAGYVGFMNINSSEIGFGSSTAGLSVKTYVGGSAIQTFSSTGISVTGDATATGLIKSTRNSTGMQIIPTTGTTSAVLQFQNTGGNAYIGMDNSAGSGYFTSGVSAYDSLIAFPSGTGLSIGVSGGAVVQRTTSTGLSVTGSVSAGSNSNAANLGFSATNTTSGTGGAVYNAFTAGSFAAYDYALSQGYTTSVQYRASSILRETSGDVSMSAGHGGGGGTYRVYVNDGLVGQYTTSGLSVTGTLSATSSLSLTGAVDHGIAQGAVVYWTSDGTPSGTKRAGIQGTSSSELKFFAGSTPTNVGVWTTTGLSVTGTLSSTSTITAAVGSTASSGVIVTGSNSPRVSVTSTGSTVTGSLSADDSAVYIGSTTNHTLYLRQNANVIVGLTSQGVTIGGDFVSRATTQPTNAINILNGTAPVGAASGQTTLYTTSGELRVMDGAGNATLLSPHDSEGYWIYDSRSPVTGKYLRIDMEKLMKAINDKFGWDFVHEFVLEQ